MTPRVAALLVLLAVWQPVGAAWNVDFAGAGPIRIGMSLQQVNRALGEHLTKDDIPGADPTGNCYQVELKTTGGVGLMFIGDTLVRIDIRGPGLRTSNGIGVGDPESAVLSAYGDRLTRSPHVYVEGGWYLTGRDAQGRLGIRFEIDAGRVADFFVGTAAAVAYIEGCA